MRAMAAPSQLRPMTICMPATSSQERAAAHRRGVLPPPAPLALRLVGQHGAGAWLAADADVAAGVQVVHGHALHSMSRKVAAVGGGFEVLVMQASRQTHAAAPARCSAQRQACAQSAAPPGASCLLGSCSP